MRRITGIQEHHVSRYPRAAGHVSNAAQYLSGIAECVTVTEDEQEARSLYADLVALNRRIWRLETRTRVRFEKFKLLDPEGFNDAVEGRRAWHDENDDVELRCSCHDRCAIHEGVPMGDNLYTGETIYEKRSAEAGWELLFARMPFATSARPHAAVSVFMSSESFVYGMCQCRPCPRHGEQV